MSEGASVRSGLTNWANRFLVRLLQIDAKRHRFHILEDSSLAKLLDEPVIDPPGDIGAIFTTVGDEYFAHGLAPLHIERLKRAG